MATAYDWIKGVGTRSVISHHGWRHASSRGAMAAYQKNYGIGFFGGLVGRATSRGNGRHRGRYGGWLNSGTPLSEFRIPT